VLASPCFFTTLSLRFLSIFVLSPSAGPLKTLPVHHQRLPPLSRFSPLPPDSALTILPVNPLYPPSPSPSLPHTTPPPFPSYPPLYFSPAFLPYYLLPSPHSCCLSCPLFPHMSTLPPLLLPAILFSAPTTLPILTPALAPPLLFPTFPLFQLSPS